MFSFSGKLKKKVRPLGNFVGGNKSMQSRRQGKDDDLLFHKFHNVVVMSRFMNNTTFSL